MRREEWRSHLETDKEAEREIDDLPTLFYVHQCC